MVTECKDDGLRDLQQNLLQEVHRYGDVMTDAHEQPHLDQKKMLMEAMISGDMASKGLMRPMDMEEEAADWICDEKQVHCSGTESLYRFWI